MLATARNAPDKARKGRTATVRPSTNLLINSDCPNSTAALRLQHLNALGVAGRRAALIAGLAWGEVSHG